MKTKKCSLCGSLLPTSDFSRDQQKSDGLTSRCKACISAQCKAYRQSDLGKKQYQKRLASGEFAERGRRYYSSPQGKAIRQRFRDSEVAKKYRRSKRRKELERARYHRPAGQAAAKRYRLSPAGRAKIARDRVKRRAATRSITATLTAQEWGQILDHHNHKCVYCGATEKRLTMDHLMPISRGGEHTKDNVVPACANCNSRKHDKTPEEFRSLTGGGN